MTRFRQNRFPASRKRGIGGFAMIELIIALSISAILAIYANQELANRSQETIARGGGVYLNAVSQAVDRLILTNFDNYANGTDIAGVANDLQPTIPELIALGRLRSGFPQGMPTRQQARIDITRTNCPGAGCQVVALVCTTTPITLGPGAVRFDLATAMLEEQNGRGGQSRYGDGANIRGASINSPNPMGNVEGIVCGSSFVDVGMYDIFVRMNDTRDPNFQGNLTVAGDTTLNGPTAINNTLNVTGPSTFENNVTVNGQLDVGPCIKLAGGPQGRAGFGCSNPADVPAGYAGGVRSADVVASGNILASTNPAGFTGANGDYAIVTANNGTGQAEIRTSGRAAANRLTPQGLFASGEVCAAADEGSIGRLSTGPGLVSCTLGFWRVITFQAAAGDACAPNGAAATDASGRMLLCMDGKFVPMDELFPTGTPGGSCNKPGVTAVDVANGNETLICRYNLAGGFARWMRLRDVTQHLAFIRADEVRPNAVVAKPVCDAASGQTAQPIIQLIPKVWGSPDGGNAFFAEDSGASWTVRMRDGAGNNLQGNPTAAAIAQLYCYFP